MSKRETILVWAVALLVGFFALDRLVISPMQAHLAQLKDDINAVQEDVDAGMVLIDNSELIESRWAERYTAGLDRDAASARLRVQGMLSEFAERAGLTLTNLSAGGNLGNDDFTEVRFSLTASGELRSVARFIERVQEADAPLALLTCDISRRDESSPRLTLRLTVSTLVYTPREAGR